MKSKKALKDLIYNIKKSEKNIFSSTSGLKGYKVGKKIYPATRQGYSQAKKHQSKLWNITKKPVSMKFLYN